MCQSKYDVGVVMVHGIGHSKHGETLIEWSDVLLKELQENANSIEVVLHKTPASLEMTASGKSYYVVESWWNGLFRPPSFLEILRWSLVSIPNTMIAHFDERYRRATYNFLMLLTSLLDLSPNIPLKERFRQVKETYDQRWILWAILLEQIVLLLGLILSPLLLVVLLFLGIISFIPQFRDIAQKIQSMLTTYAGDSLVFCKDGLMREGIISKVKSDIHKTRSECKKCVVVAHSQGAAIAHAAIKELIDSGKPAPEEFVSYGSGLRKLTDLYSFSKNQRSIKYSQLASWCALIAGLFVVLGAMGFSKPFYIGFLISIGSILICQVVMGIRMFYYFIRLTLRTSNVNDEIESRKANWIGWLAICVITFMIPFIVNYKHPFLLDTINPLILIYWIGCPIFLGLSFTLLIDWRHAVKRKTFPVDQYDYEKDRWNKVYKLEGIHWVDYYSNYDPVPNGPLFDLYKPDNYHARPIINELSFFKDHNSYLDNYDGFVSDISGVISGAPPFNTRKPPPLHLSSFREFCHRFVNFFCLFGLLFVTIDLDFISWIKELHLFGAFSDNCELVSLDGLVANLCSHPGWFEQTIVSIFPYLVLILAFITLIWLGSKFIRKIFGNTRMKDQSLSQDWQNSLK